MDRLTLLQQAIIAVMDGYITEHAHSESLRELNYEKVIDAQNFHFQLIRLG